MFICLLRQGQEAVCPDSGRKAGQAKTTSNKQTVLTTAQPLGHQDAASITHYEYERELGN